ncbi:sigma-70 family RNA polymerase sigma factor [Rathayibacter soli]|uniref:sigma-70 family RNA polymerase sigma factor n=1 Tax=Rathayibacter soli TaxID=3144168 RepID=UPI0027E5A6ED|nr:sigma-70 family RNA polymerase sigma factor [Glaciibacter superstes]
MTDQILLATRFEEHRPRLRRLARRMLGSDAEADDAVQETWLRLARTRDDDVDNLGGWLTTVCSRVCLNMLRARATRNETDFAEGLPDPVVESVADGDPAAAAQLSDAVETALLLVLDRLSPAERVAFVLHDTFDVPFAQIGELLERAPDAARQLASRARQRVRAATADADTLGADSGRGLVDAFFAAARDGNFDRLVSVLAPDVQMRADGVASATAIVRGAAQVAARAVMFANPTAVLRAVRVDGRPGVIVIVDGTPVSLFAFAIDGSRITGIDVYTGEVRLAGIRLP